MSDQSRRDQGSPMQTMRAVVVFEDRSDSMLLRVLRPGFRHCFCLVGAGSVWALCDPLKTRIELLPISGLSEVDLADSLAASGRTILRGDVRLEPLSRPIRLRLVTCVEIVRRVLNIKGPNLLTPSQLCWALLRLPGPGKPFVRHTASEIALDSDR
jgi:hypothetical protein